MSGCRDLRNFLQQFQVFGMFAEFIVAHQRAERLAAKQSELFLVYFLKHRTLIKLRSTL